MVADRARETGVAFAVCNLVGGQDELVFDGHSVIVSERAKTIARAPQFQEDLLICDIDLPTRPRSDTEVSLEEELGLDVLPTGAGIPLLARIRLPEASGAAECEIARPLDPDAEVYEALKVGLADYVRKNGFERVLVALSGGIDSALVALIATDALGPERVVCVVMPSPHSSEETQADARAIVENLG